MAAVAHLSTSDWHHDPSSDCASCGRPSLRLVPPPAPRRRSLSPGVYRRRRIGVGALVLAAGFALRLLLGGLGGGPLPASEPNISHVRPVAQAVHVVQPGDTMWTIARSLQPEGDVRPLVDRLAEARDGRPLTVGERIELPTR